MSWAGEVLRTHWLCMKLRSTGCEPTIQSVPSGWKSNLRLVTIRGVVEAVIR